MLINVFNKVINVGCTHENDFDFNNCNEAARSLSFEAFVLANVIRLV